MVPPRRKINYQTLIDSFSMLKNKLSIVLLSTVLLSGVTSFKKCKTCFTHTTFLQSGGQSTTISTYDEYCKDDYDNAPENSLVKTETSPGDTTVVEVICSDN